MFQNVMVAMTFICSSLPPPLNFHYPPGLLEIIFSLKNIIKMRILTTGHNILHFYIEYTGLYYGIPQIPGFLNTGSF